MALDQDRLHEIDLLIPVLRILANQNTGSLRTSNLRESLEKTFKISGKDAVPTAGGGSQTLFSQIVRNIVSNRSKGNNMINLGFADYANGVISIADKGRQLLVFVGYKK